MTIFKITNDDIGVRGLQGTNKHPVSTKEVQATQPSRPVEKSPENQQYLYQNRAPEDYVARQPQDRRQEKQAVPIDTRSQADRRHQQEESKKSESVKHHIDELV